MKRERLHVWVVAVAVLTLLSAIGCGGKQQPPAAPGEEKSPTPPPPEGESDAVRKYKLRVKEMSEAAEAGRLSLVEQFLKDGASANDKDDSGQTPLHWAAAGGHREVCELLLYQKANVIAVDKQGQTAVHKAAANGRLECVELLVYHDARTWALLTQKDAAGRSPLLLAAAGGHVRVFNLFKNDLIRAEKLVREATADGKTALDLARAGKHAEVVAYLERLRAISTTFTGDAVELEKMYKSDPANFPASWVVIAACEARSLPALRKVLDLYADKPVREKAALLAAPAGHTDFPALFLAVHADWADGAAALTDPKWWNDPAALKTYINAGHRISDPVLNDGNKSARPAAYAAVQKALDAAEKMK